MRANNHLTHIHEELNKTKSEAFYILQPEIFKDEYDALLRAFKKFYTKSNIAYSFKTNYIPTFLDIVREKGGYAEVVSIMEAELALKVGFLPHNIFFNGPFKHKRETLELLSLGVLVNLDSYDEFLWIENFASQSKTKCRVGIRLNFNLPKNPSRFGISIDDKSIHEIVKKCYSHEYLSLESLHYHYAPRDLSIWISCADEFLTFLNTLDPVYLPNIRYISLGGGMFSSMDEYIRDQLKFKIPSFHEYAENSIRHLSKFIKSASSLSFKPEILIEPGTALASKALDFAVKVVSVKKIQNTYYINTSGSKFNMNPSPNRINSPIEVFHSQGSDHISVRKGKIAGYTCIESDIIHDDYNGRIGEGDTIIFKEIGAYSVVMKPPFILPDVAIIQFNKNAGRYETVSRKQTFSDIFNRFENMGNDGFVLHNK